MRRPAPAPTIAAAALVAALASVVGAGVGVARADDAALARFHDERAREHYEHGRYDDALTEFFLEQRLAPNPRILFNIALCFDRLHRDEEAFLFYQEYAASDDIDETRRAHVATAIARLEPTLARVRVTTDPTGASVFVDDRDLGSYGTSPRILALAPGDHHLVVELEGYRTAEIDVHAERGTEAPVELALERIVGLLRVSSSTSGDVSVRDESSAVVASGPAPLEASLPPGVYSIEVVAEGHRRWREVARVAPDGEHSLEARPDPLPPRTGEITVSANVAGAIVELDGEPAGFAPTVLSGVAVGEHSVAVHADGVAPWEDRVRVEPDVRSWLTVTLVRPAETTRSEWTWGIGAVGLASAAVWAVLFGLAIDNRARFSDAEAAGDPRVGIRDRGVVLDAAADVALGVTTLTLGAAVVLYFTTERTESRESTAVVSRGELE